MKKHIVIPGLTRIHSGTLPFGGPEWIPDLRFAASGMTVHITEAVNSGHQLRVRSPNSLAPSTDELVSRTMLFQASRV